MREIGENIDFEIMWEMLNLELIWSRGGPRHQDYPWQWNGEEWSSTQSSTSLLDWMYFDIPTREGEMSSHTASSGLCRANERTDSGQWEAL